MGSGGSARRSTRSRAKASPIRTCRPERPTPMSHTRAILPAMQVTGFDERHLTREAVGANFVVFIYEGGTPPTGPGRWTACC